MRNAHAFVGACENPTCTIKTQDNLAPFATFSIAGSPQEFHSLWHEICCRRFWLPHDRCVEQFLFDDCGKFCETGGVKTADVRDQLPNANDVAVTVKLQQWRNDNGLVGSLSLSDDQNPYRVI